jgi:serine/threonine protein phosphatase 1
MPRLIAIGDVHGCSRALEAVLEAVAPSADDLIVMLGDYIDRGPDSRGVLDRLVRLQEECTLRPLRGNHELLFLAALKNQEEFHFWLACGGQATLASYGGSLENVPELHREFIRACLPYFETDEFFFVHANYEPDLPLDGQPEEVLYWKHLLYGIPPRHASGKTAVVGHTPQPTGEVLNLGHILCLDTYCFGDGWLTAMELTTGEIWQADKFGRRRDST